ERDGLARGGVRAVPRERGSAASFLARASLGVSRRLPACDSLKDVAHARACGTAESAGRTTSATRRWGDIYALARLRPPRRPARAAIAGERTRLLDHAGKGRPGDR